MRLDLPLSFNELLRSQREDCQAGAQPQSTPARNIAARLKNSTGRFKRTSASVGIENGGNMARIAFSIAQARLTPRMPPINASARLSVKNWVKSCERFAPREARIATSFWRTVPRANSILATFTQAINKTNPTAPISSHRPLIVS